MSGLYNGFGCALLDFDMTVVDLFDFVDMFALRRDVRELLLKNGFEVKGMKNLPVGLLRSAYERDTGEESTRGERWSRVSELVCAYETEAADRAIAYTDTVPFLKDLRESGVRTAIVSSNCEDSIEKALLHLDISSYFDCVVGRGSVKWKMKPSPLCVNLALGKMGMKAEDAFVVGDTTADMRSFSSAGVLPIGIAGGVSTREQLMAAGASQVVSRLKDVGQALRQATR